MNAGKLVPSDITVKLLKKRMLQEPNVCYLLDGFPRNQENVDVLNKVCGDMVNILELIFIETSDETMLARLTKRAGEAEVKREDDNEEVQKNRIEVFKNESLPVVEMMEGKNLVCRLDGNKTADEVYEQCDAHLKEKGLGKYATKA
jgi:adenylate kinase family enzyme